MGRVTSRAGTAAALAFVCVVGAGAGCGGGDDDTATPTVTIQQSSAPATDGRVEVDAGASAAILVPENPTTGYELEIDRAPDAAVATATEGDYEQSEPEADGSGGFHQFDIEGKSAGTTTLGLRAVGPGGERGDTYSIEIVVR